MKNIQSYEEFVNEEINLKNAIATAALGASLAMSPTPTMAKEPIQTTQTQETSREIDFSDIVIVDDAYSKLEIRDKILREIRNVIPDSRVKSYNSDEIYVNILMDSKPDETNGHTFATMKISVKDGKFKVEVYDIYFVYSGMQPRSVGKQVSQNVGNTVRNIAVQRATGMIPNREFGNVVNQALTQITRPQPESRQPIQFSEAKESRKMKDYVLSVEDETYQLIDNLSSLFNKTTQDDW